MRPVAALAALAVILGGVVAVAADDAHPAVLHAAAVSTAHRAIYRCNRCKRPIGDGDRALGHTLCGPCRDRGRGPWAVTVPAPRA